MKFILIKSTKFYNLKLISNRLIILQTRNLHGLDLRDAQYHASFRCEWQGTLSPYIYACGIPPHTPTKPNHPHTRPDQTLRLSPTFHAKGSVQPRAKLSFTTWCFKARSSSTTPTVRLLFFPLPLLQSLSIFFALWWNSTTRRGVVFWKINLVALVFVKSLALICVARDDLWLFSSSTFLGVGCYLNCLLLR